VSIYAPEPCLCGNADKADWFDHDDRCPFTIRACRILYAEAERDRLAEQGRKLIADLAALAGNYVRAAEGRPLC